MNKSMPKLNKATGKPWTLEEYNERRRELNRLRYQRPDVQANTKRDLSACENIDEGFDPYPIANGDDRVTFNLGDGCRRIVPHYQH